MFAYSQSTSHQRKQRKVGKHLSWNLFAHLLAGEDEEEADDDADHDEEARLGEDVRQLGRHVESWKEEEIHGSPLNNVV